MEEDPKRRFSNRATYYAKYRPRYPTTILNFMEEELELSKDSVIADIGSGTGILSELFLRHGNKVFGVEPNDEMRRAAEEQLASYPAFASVNGSAEETTLPSQSVNFVTAGQSFHWFEPAKARTEFSKILKTSGWTLLIWNSRKNSTSFMQAYNRLVNQFSNRRHPRAQKVGAEILETFYSRHVKKTFDNSQTLDFEGLKGRLLSSSYSPMMDDPLFPSMLADLQRIFNSHEKHGTVQMEYETEVYYGQLSN